MIRQKRKQRKKEMFAVGMIVTCHDKIRARSLTGVIIGWDEEFNAHVEMEWKQCRLLYNNSNILSQPFYKVLCENNKAYYVIEGKSKLLEASYIFHRYISILYVCILYMIVIFIIYVLIYT